MYVFFYIFHFSNNKAVIFMKYFFINMTAFSVFIKLFLFHEQFISEIHSLSAAMFRCCPKPFPITFPPWYFYILTLLYFNAINK